MPEWKGYEDGVSGDEDRIGQCVYPGVRCHCTCAIGIFLRVLGRKRQEITFLVSTSPMSSALLSSANCEERLAW